LANCQVTLKKRSYQSPARLTSILQFWLCDNEGHLRLFLLKCYKIFGLTPAQMAWSSNLLSQSYNMLIVQLTIFYSKKLETPINIIKLSSESYKDKSPSIPLPIVTPDTSILVPKFNKLLKSFFTPIGSNEQLNFSCPPFHPSTYKCPSIV
jgi:hypothetical protein